jgi:type VI secretion system secreted protein VgrG
MDPSPRQLSLTCSLGEGVLTAIALHAVEAIDAPFSISVEMVGSTDRIDPDSMLAHGASVTLDTNDGPVRHFHGIVRSFEATGGSSRQGALYRMELVPRLWFASQTQDCRIFHKKSSKEIIETLLDENQIHPVSFKISEEPPKRDYTVQYNETDLQFMTRLMQQDGISYFFEHSETDHTIVLFDNKQAFTDLAESTFNFVADGQERDVISGWAAVNEIATGKVTLLDYEPQTPKVPVRGETATVLETSNKELRDVTQWPALRLTRDEANLRARRLQAAAEAHAVQYSGRGANPLMQPGCRIQLDAPGAGASGSSSSAAAGDPAAFALGGKFVIRSVVHQAVGNADVSGNDQLEYHNSFTAFPADLEWRPLETVAPPRMAGIFSAVVVGADGEDVNDINIDKQGCIQVCLLFDHRKDSTAAVTLPVRVMQPWAGKGWGWQHVPRVGSEVAIAFVDGDPDRPLVVGGLYNGEQTQPFPPSDDKTKTGLRTRSSPGGGTGDYCEFSFDDRAGKELAYLRAQKDFTVDVMNDNTVTIKGKQTITIEDTQTTTIKGKQTIEVGDAQSVTVSKGRKTVIEQGGDELTVQVGDITVKASAGAIKLTAMQSLELVVGSSKVKLDPMGVTMSGMMVKIEGTAMLESKAPMHTVKGDGMLMVNGGVVMVN